LLGAIALVLAAVLVLPMIFDTEPRSSPPPVSVRIPGEEDAGFTPKVTSKPAAPTPALEAPKPEPAAAPLADTQKSGAPDAPEKAVDQAAERARAEAALAGGEQFFIQVGAYADAAKVTEKLKSANLPYFTEPLATAKGTVIRVRAGPFASREAAERAAEQLKTLGFKPGNVAAKS
jgi:DedD protein